MASVHVCDGCGEVLERVPAPHPPFGRIYCDRCEDLIADYSAKRDELHNKVAKQWKAGLARLGRPFKGLLPDA